jgi:putative flippase GtrA
MTGKVRTPVAFLIGGGLNSALSYGVYLLLVLFMDYQEAYLLAYLLGIASSYWINSVFVFHAPLSMAGLMKFPLVHIVQYTASAGLLWVLVEWADVSSTIAPLLVTVTLVPVSFFLSRMVLRQAHPSSTV